MVDSRTDELILAVQRLSLARTLPAVQQVVRTAARKLTGADGATFVLRHGDQCRYVDEDAIAPLWKGKSFPLEDCISGWVMLNAEPVAIADIYRDDRIPHDAYRPTFVRSLAMVPIRREDPIGAIGIYWAESRTPDERELELLHALAGSTAVAMESVALWTELDERVQERTIALEQALALNEHILGTLAHEIRNALTASGGLLDLVLRTAEAQLAPKTRKYLQFALSATEDGSASLEAQLQAVKDRVGELRPRMSAVRIDDVLRELAVTHGALAADAQIEVQVGEADHPETVWTDERLLVQALRNLMSNAVKFTASGHVRVGAAVDGHGRVAFTVSDTGVGIPPAEHQRIFDDWVQRADGADREGAGLGLPFVKRVAAVLGGEVNVTSRIGQGSTFTLAIPAGARDERFTSGQAPGLTGAART